MTRVFRAVLAAAFLAGAAPAALSAAPPAGELTAVRITSAPGRVDFVMQVQGAVRVSDFYLADPDRLVLDVAGATLKSGQVKLYDGVKRGGITNVRYSQFKPGVVRIVLDLESPRPYSIEQQGDQIRVSFTGETPSFQAWASDAGRTPRVVTAAAVLPDDEPEAEAEDEAPLPRAASAPREAYPEVRLTRTSAAQPAAWRDEPRITVTWDRASIADVVAGFAAFSGRTIILGKDIKGEVTAEIKNQPWPQAFAAVLATQGLTAQEMPGGIIRVDAPSVLASLDSLEPLETNVVRVNYAQASGLTKTVESILTKGRGRVVADTASNSLIITDTKSRVGSVADFVRGLDLKTPQISIQAKIVFVDRSNLEQLGVKYDLGSQNQFFNKLIQRTDPSTGDPYKPTQNVIDLGGNTVSAIANADANIVGSALDLVFSTALGGFNLTTFLQALEVVQLSDVQAEPVISTLDNRPADILVGEEVPLRVVDASSATVAGQAPRATVQFRETGIRLTVTPHVTANRQILMNLRTERSSVVPLAAADLGFIFQKQLATNQLLVNDGETAVIGGLTLTEVKKSRSGIPLLGGLPIVGKLFSYSSDEERRRDLIILVTPRIVDDGQPAE
ncbi:MAG TPA: AMIN domain-containing protein [Gemmatimonadales bacterium]|nr:AMIN domain-containing protein [Gemmatimonadales bacterium]